MNITLHLLASGAFAGPAPGDVFREHIWTMPAHEGNEAYLRVGGRFDYRQQTPGFPEGVYKDGWIRLPDRLELVHATRAEVEIQKTLCHDNTTGLAIAINQGPFHRFPEAEGIPTPKAAYQHHFTPVVEVPLESFREGADNWFSLKVDPEQPWNWPQNLVYGVVVRLYYDTSQLPGPPARMRPLDTFLVQPVQLLGVDCDDPQRLRRVDFIGNYDGPDMEGNGVYHKWHYYHFRDSLRGHFGTAQEAPFEVHWDTGWTPDQDAPFSISAIVSDEEGYKYFLDPVEAKGFARKHRVEFCKPYDQPVNWTTRNDAFVCSVDIQGNLSKAIAARIVWRSWSPGYMNGLYLNDYIIFEREGANYAYHEHALEIKEMEFLRPGANSIRTGLTPRHMGAMVHGADIFWPGFMLLVKYDPAHEPPPYAFFPQKPGQKDFSAQFRGVWDAVGLWVDVAVEDDHVTAEDAIAVLVRAKREQIRDDVVSDDADFLFQMGPETSDQRVFRDSVQSAPLDFADDNVARQVTGNGWRVVLRIPWNFIGVTQENETLENLQLGFEVSVGDVDADPDQKDHLTWNDRDRVPAYWIEHNYWGIARLKPSEPDAAVAGSSETDWTSIPLAYPARTVLFPHHGGGAGATEGDAGKSLDAVPYEPIQHWLPR